MSASRGDLPAVTAIVLNYRAREAASAAVAGLAPAHAAGLLECIVVDNASGDGSGAYLRARHPWATVVDNGENIGFGRGCNIGLDRVRTPYVLLLNPDAVLSAADLSVLVEFMARTPAAGMIAPAIRTLDGRLQHAGGAPSPRHILLQACRPHWRPRTSAPIGPDSEPFRTDWLCGAVLLLRTAMLRQIGTFDPRFFLYFEESDLCRRALAGGWELWAVGRAVAHHACGLVARATGAPLVHGCIAEHYFRSRFRFLVKHHGALVACLTETAELLVMTCVSLARRIAGRDIGDYLTRLRSPMFGLPAGKRP